MFKIVDGREHFFQWDLDRKLIVYDTTISEVHFNNGENALVCKVYDADELRMVNVPNILLQKEGCIIIAYAYDSNYTKRSATFDVVARPKPDDYIYTETELYTVEAMLNDALEEAKASGDFKGDKGEPGAKGDKGEPGRDAIVTDAEVVQEAGNSETAVMSQKATTDYVKDYVPKVQTRNIMLTNFENALLNENGVFPRTDGLKYAACPDYIEVIGGETYVLSCDKKTWFTSSTLYVYQYDVDKNYIGIKSLASLDQIYKTVTLNENCIYVRIGMTTWLADVPWETLVPDKFQMELGDKPSDYIPPKAIGSASIDHTATDYLYCKRLVACGDSITDAYNGEAGSGYYESYAEITAKRHGMIFTKNAVSGSTMAYNASGGTAISTSAFSNTRYLDLPEFDYLTLWFGWNDHAYSELGTIEDADNTTFYGAYKIVLEHLITNNPTKKIGLVVPYGIKSTKMEAIAQAVRDISKMYGVPCLDLRDYNECSGFWGIDNDAQLARRAALTYDTTHPNQAGHEYLSTMFDNFIKRL